MSIVTAAWLTVCVGMYGVILYTNRRSSSVNGDWSWYLIGAPLIGACIGSMLCVPIMIVGSLGYTVIDPLITHDGECVRDTVESSWTVETVQVYAGGGWRIERDGFTYRVTRPDGDTFTDWGLTLDPSVVVSDTLITLLHRSGAVSRLPFTGARVDSTLNEGYWSYPHGNASECERRHGKD